MHHEVLSLLALLVLSRYKSTDTDADAACAAVSHRQGARRAWQVLSLFALLVQKYKFLRSILLCMLLGAADAGTKFTCFTSAKVQRLTQLMRCTPAQPPPLPRSPVVCGPSVPHSAGSTFTTAPVVAQFTGFTGTKKIKNLTLSLGTARCRIRFTTRLLLPSVPMSRFSRYSICVICTFVLVKQVKSTLVVAVVVCRSAASLDTLLALLVQKYKD